MTLLRAVQSQHRSLSGALDRLEALTEAAPGDDLLTALVAVDRALLAHDVTTERFVVGPLRQLHMLDPEQLAAFRDELEDLTDESTRLATAAPDPAAVGRFVRVTRQHIERKAHFVVPAARTALCEGRLPAAPTWFVDEVYSLQGGPVQHWPEEWLG